MSIDIIEYAPSARGMMGKLSRLLEVDKEERSLVGGGEREAEC